MTSMVVEHQKAGNFRCLKSGHRSHGEYMILKRIIQRFGLILCASAAVANAQEVIPDFYKEPGIQPGRDFVNQSHHENIDPFTGSLQRHYVDIRIPGNGGLDLKIIRSYNSSNINSANPAQPRTTAGWGWTIHFGRILKARDAHPCLNMNRQTIADNPVLELPDGSRQLLTFTSSMSPMAITARRWKAECYPGGGGLIVTSPDGVVYEMSQSTGANSNRSPVYEWYTKKITDRNGNYISIQYTSESSPEIRNITTSDGRSMSFSYHDPGTRSARIRSITSAGQTYQYNYQSSGILDIYQLTSVTRPDGNTWVYGYNGNKGLSAGSYLMRSAKNPYGGTIDYTYEHVYFDTQSNPRSRSDVVSRKSLGSGENWTFSYAPGNSRSLDTTTVTGPAGTSTYKHIGPIYASAGNLWKVGLLVEKTIGNTQAEQYTWEGQKISSETYFRPGAFLFKIDYLQTNAPLLTQKTITRNGVSYRTDYSNFDEYGNPRSISESGPNGGSRTTTASYYINTPKWIIRQVQNESFTGNSITRQFDGKGNLTTETRNGVSVSFIHDTQGNVESITFPRSLTHRYSNHMRGIPKNESQPESISITRQVDDAGNVVSETDGSGHTTRYSYDGLNRITSIEPPVGNRVSIAYGTNTRTATRGSLTETRTYNDYGHLIQLNRGGISSTYSVDALGRTTFESDPDNSRSGRTYSYDNLHRVTRIQNADNTAKTISYGGNSKTVRDERNNSTTYTYRAYGNPDQEFLMGISTPESSASVSYSRNSRDLITSATQDRMSRSYAYNTAGHLISATHPESGTTTYGRDAAGNMTSKSTGSAGIISYTHDQQNRLKTIVYPGSTPSVAYAYDGAHRLLSSISSDATRQFTYDGNGNLKSEQLSAGGTSWTAQYGYNENDHLTSIVYPRSGDTVTYSVNSLGRPTSIPGYIDAVSYWPSGQVKEISYANGTQSIYGQNSRLLPSTFVTYSRSGTYYGDFTFSYDAVGNLTRIMDYRDSLYNRSFSYDDMDRLSRVTTAQGTGNISYSGSGNITAQNIPGTQLTYQYDANNRLSSLSAVPSTLSATYTYDTLGNIASGGGRTFTYDAVPNLKCVNCATPASSVQYAYDANQKRTSVTQGITKTHEFHGAHGNLLSEYTPGSPGKLIQYIYLNGKRVAQKESTQ
ncbi:RHS repeat domain-containing protein [Verminephrobacter aporrectodeae]|nr:hypothetical protein [Verminephrobacter aporrectodeae]